MTLKERNMIVNSIILEIHDGHGESLETDISEMYFPKKQAEQTILTVPLSCISTNSVGPNSAL